MSDIPVLTTEGQCLAEAWENSLLELWKNGCEMPTDYDADNDPPSKDATMTITVREPLSDPQIHRDIPGGLDKLQEYVMEVTEGIKDHWVTEEDDGRWTHTYHQRLFNFSGYDQIESLAKKLANSPTSRRAQAVTWLVPVDNDSWDPPCMQSIWCRLTPDGVAYKLNMNVRFRSNDAYKAAFMNMFALVSLQRYISGRIEHHLDYKYQVISGRYVHMVDSYHLYGSYIEEFRNRFLRNIENRNFVNRTYWYEDVEDIMKDAEQEIRNNRRI